MSNRSRLTRAGYWRWLLFEPGQGWLRWGAGTRESWCSYYEPPEPYGVLPPLRRAWYVVRYREAWPLKMRDEDRAARVCW